MKLAQIDVKYTKVIPIITYINNELLSKIDKQNAYKQEKYLKGLFSFFGLTRPQVKNISIAIIKQYNPSLQDTLLLCEYLYTQLHREYHYIALDLLIHKVKELDLSHIHLLEHIIVTHSWWDSIDTIATNIVGVVFMKSSIERQQYLDKWEASDNLWLWRTCIIFQLKYKEQTDLQYLGYICSKLALDKQFFIRKAIGWALRELSKTNPNWVVNFVNNHQELSNLSKSEALRLIKKQK